MCVFVSCLDLIFIQEMRTRLLEDLEARPPSTLGHTSSRLEAVVNTVVDERKDLMKIKQDIIIITQAIGIVCFLSMSGSP